jgi:NADPH-dependent 2,4-dienoyl-CoA reductase/sulfur reductase-like enzyme/nitrite reductase/ring-hydroxylating ferredoxin subunit
MTQEQAPPAGPDLALGVALSDLRDGKLLGHVGDEDVLVVRTATGVFAIGAHCSHYNGPLAEGIVVGDSVRCPWHHACFDLASGEAVRAPALAPVDCWTVEKRDGKVFVTQKRKASPKREPAAPPVRSADAPARIVIVGGGAAGLAAADMLRRRGFGGSIAMLSHDGAPPVDRPNLSKDYLAGSAPEDWLPLRPSGFFADNGIALRLDTEVVGIDVKDRAVMLAGGERLAYDRLLLATGAEPVRLEVPGADRPHVHVLRSLADCRAIIVAAASARRVLIIGASFIGLEAAAALRNRGLDVHVVAPDRRPMERVFGPQMGDFVRALHEARGVVFHLDDTVAAISDRSATLASGGTLDADLVIVGVGVHPRLALAEQAGLAIDRGVVVDEYLETSVGGIYAAGDIARWPDRYSGDRIRVEHWVVAERQGQTAALNMLGLRRRFDAVPFFWSQHYDVAINYAGHAESWDDIVIEGDIEARDCLLRYKRGGRVLAVASIFRDVDNLRFELAMEEGAACHR